MKHLRDYIKRDELKILENKLDSLHTEHVKCEEDYNVASAAIREEISALTLRRINTFPPNVPCTFKKLSDTVGVSVEQVEAHMIRSSSYSHTYERSMYNFIHIIDTAIPNRIYTNSGSIHVIIQPNWKLCVRHNGGICVERIESEKTK